MLKLFFKEEAESKIMRFMERADFLSSEGDFGLGYSFLKQATRLYNENFNGYNPEIDKEFNEIFLSFIQKSY